MIDDGHLFMVTRPGETARFIEEFLASPNSEPARRAGGHVFFRRQAIHIDE